MHRAVLKNKLSAPKAPINITVIHVGLQNYVIIITFQGKGFWKQWAK